MRVALITLGSTLATSAVIANAFYQKKQFYPSIVYLTKSNPCLAILYAQAFVAVFLLGKALRKIFFGQLRAAELEHLIEKFWYVITETCLAFTVFRDDFSPRFVALFTFLLFMKAFHWLIEDRVDYMERTPVITWLFHVRVIGLLLVLGTLDSVLIHHAFRTTLTSGASVQMVFGFEYSILLTMVVAIVMKYILHTIDNQHENPWENKNVYLLYAELITGFVKCFLYIMFVGVMVKIHTFPLFAIRPMYLTVRAFKKSLSDVILSRRAIAYMNTRFPNATEQELRELDNTCIICREQLLTGKKLPCNHIFHTHCLRSWFQRQQSCPTCRLDVLSSQPQQTPRPPPAQPQRPQMPQQQPGGFNRLQSMMGVNNLMFPPAPPQPPQPPEFLQSTQGQTSATGSTTFTAPPVFSQQPQMAGNPLFGNMMFPSFVPPPPFSGVPLPHTLFHSPSTDLSGLSEDTLREMEGQERANVEARVRVLRNVHTLLDTAILQLNQYSQVIQNLNSLSNPSQASAHTSVSLANVATNTQKTETASSVQANVTDASRVPIMTSLLNGSFGATENITNAGSPDGSTRFRPSTNITKTKNNSNTQEINGVEEISQATSEDENEVRKRRIEKFQNVNKSNDSSKT